MKIFRAVGKFIAKGREIKFTKEVYCKDLEDARERIYTVFGSKHRVKRRAIFIDEIKEISPDEAKIRGGK
ncbi:MAG: 50S ribosomal protein L18Ae [Candidatus Thermoplasmatota archaeon]